MDDADGRALRAVGIDGGGTHTRVLLVDGSGRRLGAGTSGSGNLHDVGAERLAQHVDEAWRAAWSEAGEAPRPADAVFCGMASVGTEPNRSTVRDVVARVGVGSLDAVHVDIDLVAALAGGLGGRDGIVVIAGTGSSCFGRDPSGRTFQSGGWGSLLDDVGSATWLGTQALVAAIRAHDGRGLPTLLERRVMEHFGLASMRELLPAIDERGGAERSARAALAPLVTRAAEDADGLARGLLVDGAHALGECVEAVWRTLDFGDGPVEVTLTGGLGENVPRYRDAFHRNVGERVTSAVCVLPRASNLVGAALVALERLPGGRTEAARRRLVGGG
ncbi:MAG: BadF/BadG/BcrA/BcrD ATPase family protein [Planctomycetota bacterium]